jgi:hypothetical protein
MIENPLKSDELVETLTNTNEVFQLDLLKPEEGFYYLWDAMEGRVATSIYGEVEFSSYERARFARSCSTRWPFLKVYRHWKHSQSKLQAQARCNERQKVMDSLLGNTREWPRCGFEL